MQPFQSTFDYHEAGLLVDSINGFWPSLKGLERKNVYKIICNLRMMRQILTD